MIEYRVGDIFEQADLTHIVHQANLFNTFGAGIAKEIKRRYPQAFEADAESHAHAKRLGQDNRLGGFSRAICTDGKCIVNLYSQIGIGSYDRKTSYDAMDKGLRLVREWLKEENYSASVVLGVPYKIGCGLANGDWQVVIAIIRCVFQDAFFKVVVCCRKEEVESAFIECQGAKR